MNLKLVTGLFVFTLSMSAMAEQHSCECEVESYAYSESYTSRSSFSVNCPDAEESSDLECQFSKSSNSATVYCSHQRTSEETSSSMSGYDIQSGSCTLY